jgi:hypothetical protein
LVLEVPQPERVETLHSEVLYPKVVVLVPLVLVLLVLLAVLVVVLAVQAVLPLLAG